jgi:S-disulfanyl-L-cysteine oxidoreductase SoxD
MGRSKPDVAAVACMKNCAGPARLASFLPDFARDSHGNLAEQNRAVGAQRGADTRRPAAAAPGGIAAAVTLTQKYGCVACHGMENKSIGPSFRDVANMHAGRADAIDYLAAKIKAGGSGVWGAMPMPAQALSEAEAKILAQWLVQGLGRQ